MADPKKIATKQLLDLCYKNYLQGAEDICKCLRAAMKKVSEEDPSFKFTPDQVTALMNDSSKIIEETGLNAKESESWIN